MNYKYEGLEIRPIMKEMLVGDEKPLTEKRFVLCEVIGDNVVYPFKTIEGGVPWDWDFFLPKKSHPTNLEELKMGWSMVMLLLIVLVLNVKY